ncbi:acyl-CoA dehydrogenase family protein [Bradyrhizobium sp. 141]|uniref:acyl-CoA dehydrogenase family protein n=1 Tax=Bradyrhizobium sp. 141 TaxID=2782617 RepID=UPI001FF95A3A
MLFPPGDGFKRAMAGVDVARTLVAALCCGMMEALLDCALAATNDRTAFGSKTIDFQGCNGCWRTSRRTFTPRGCCSLLRHPSSIAVSALALTPPTRKSSPREPQ